MTSSTHRLRSAGFTLMEVLITVAIVGILAAIALPSYNETIMRSKLVDGTTKLGDFRTQMEKFFLDNRTYIGGAGCGVPNPVPGSSDHFAITCVAPTATTFTVTATGRPATGMPAAFVYTVDQANVRTSAGPVGWTPGAGCWAIRKSGSCS